MEEVIMLHRRILAASFCAAALSACTEGDALAPLPDSPSQPEAPGDLPSVPSPAAEDPFYRLLREEGIGIDILPQMGEARVFAPRIATLSEALEVTSPCPKGSRKIVVVGDAPGIVVEYDGEAVEPTLSEMRDGRPGASGRVPFRVFSPSSTSGMATMSGSYSGEAVVVADCEVTDGDISVLYVEGELLFEATSPTVIRGSLIVQRTATSSPEERSPFEGTTPFTVEAPDIGLRSYLYIALDKPGLLIAQMEY